MHVLPMQIAINPETGFLTRTFTFPYRIGADLVSTGVAYGSKEFNANLWKAFEALLESGWILGYRDAEYLQWLPEHNASGHVSDEEMTNRLVEVLYNNAPKGTRFGGYQYPDKTWDTDWGFWLKEG